MSKNTPEGNTSLDARSRTPKERWLKRHRGAIALALSLGVACGCCAKPTPPSVTTGEQEKDAPAPAMTSSATPTMTGPVSELKAVREMPSPCELREGTFLADSDEFSQFCEGEPIKEGEGCKSVDDWQKASLVRQMKSNAVFDLIRRSLAERGINNKGDLLEADVVKDFQGFETLPDSYKAALKEFNPVLYESLKDRIYIKKMDALTKGISGSFASASGPLDLEENSLVPSLSGQYHAVRIGELSDINIKEALQKNDRASIAQFLLNSSALTHEIYGHIFLSDKRLVDTYGTRFLKFDEHCSKGIPERVKDELHAYFVGARMIAFMAERYPKVQKILQETYANRENFQAQMEQKAVCSHNEAVDFLSGETAANKTLLRLDENYDAYQKAQKTGNWKPFKDMIMAKTLTLQFGLPYVLAYLKSHGREDCASTLNKKLEAMINKESPEKLFEKK